MSRAGLGTLLVENLPPRWLGGLAHQGVFDGQDGNRLLAGLNMPSCCRHAPSGAICSQDAPNPVYGSAIPVVESEPTHVETRTAVTTKQIDNDRVIVNEWRFAPEVPNGGIVTACSSRGAMTDRKVEVDEGKQEHIADLKAAGFHARPVGRRATRSSMPTTSVRLCRNRNRP